MLNFAIASGVCHREKPMFFCAALRANPYTETKVWRMSDPRGQKSNGSVLGAQKAMVLRCPLCADPDRDSETLRVWSFLNCTNSCFPGLHENTGDPFLDF